MKRSTNEIIINTLKDKRWGGYWGTRFSTLGIFCNVFWYYKRELTLKISFWVVGVVLIRLYRSVMVSSRLNHQFWNGNGIWVGRNLIQSSKTPSCSICFSIITHFYCSKCECFISLSKNITINNIFSLEIFEKSLQICWSF